MSEATEAAAGIEAAAAPEDEGRPPAPAPLEVVRQFVNTFGGESGVDELGDAALTATGLADPGLLEGSVEVTDADRRRVVELREALRKLLLANNGEPLDQDA